MRVLSLKEVQERLGVSKSSFNRSIRDSIPIIQISPGRLGVREDAFAAWLDSRPAATERRADRRTGR